MFLQIMKLARRVTFLHQFVENVSFLCFDCSPGTPVFHERLFVDVKKVFSSSEALPRDSNERKKVFISCLMFTQNKTRLSFQNFKIILQNIGIYKDGARIFAGVCVCVGGEGGCCQPMSFPKCPKSQCTMLKYPHVH